MRPKLGSDMEGERWLGLFGKKGPIFFGHGQNGLSKPWARRRGRAKNTHTGGWTVRE